jgi:hypothetical protein
MQSKVSKGEALALHKELEACVGPAKQRGCLICRNMDQTVVQVARDKGYQAEQVAEFLIRKRSYPESLMNRGVVYRHWYRCATEANGSN